jgi:hypothetical protein
MITQLRVRFQNILSHSDLPTKTLYAPPLYTYMPHALPISFSLISKPEVHITTLHIKQSPPLPCQLHSVIHKYLPQHPILKHPQPEFFFKYESKTAVLYILIFLKQTVRLNGKEFMRISVCS